MVASLPELGVGVLPTLIDYVKCVQCGKSFTVHADGSSDYLRRGDGLVCRSCSVESDPRWRTDGNVARDSDLKVQVEDRKRLAALEKEQLTDNREGEK